MKSTEFSIPASALRLTKRASSILSSEMRTASWARELELATWVLICFSAYTIWFNLPPRVSQVSCSGWVLLSLVTPAPREGVARPRRWGWPPRAGCLLASRGKGRRGRSSASPRTSCPVSSPGTVSSSRSSSTLYWWVLIYFYGPLWPIWSIQPYHTTHFRVYKIKGLY